MWLSEMGQILGEEFNQNGYNIGHQEAPYCIMRFAALFDRRAAMAIS